MVLMPLQISLLVVLVEDGQIPVSAYLGDTVDLVPDHCNKANFVIQRVIHIFWFPREKLANVFCKGPHNKHVRCCRPYDLCQNYSTLSFQCRSIQRQHMGISSMALLMCWDALLQVAVLLCRMFNSIPGHWMPVVPPSTVTIRNFPRPEKGKIIPSWESLT